LYRTVPRAAKADPQLHRILALSDALRIGGARERREAGRPLRKELDS